MLFEALRPQAAVVIVPIWGKKAEVDMQKIVLKELDVRGTISYVSNHPEAIELVESGKLDLTPFITGKIHVDNLINEGFNTLIHRNEAAVEILVTTDETALHK